MTCIIGTDRWICADRRIFSSAGERCQNERKVWRNRHMVVGCSGDAAQIHNVRDLVRRGCDDHTDLIKAVGSTAYALCLVAGRLYEVSEGAVFGPVRPLRCIGSGGDLARGYLELRAVNETSARAAQRFVARLRTDCGGGVDFLSPSA